jgi:hypothetical protein
MFNGFVPQTITVHWLSGFDQSRFETWMAKRASIATTEDTLIFQSYLIWPVEEAEEVTIEIRRAEAGLVLESDWFPDEEFPVQAFFSKEADGILLMSSYERETVFIHLQAEVKLVL